MTRFRPADRRFGHHWRLVIWQCELDADIFSGNERNLRGQSHAPNANIYARAATLLSRLPREDDGQGDWVTKVASPYLSDRAEWEEGACLSQNSGAFNYGSKT